MAVASPKGMKGIVIIAKSKGWNMAFTHLDCIEMQNGANGEESGMDADNFKAKALALIWGNYRSYPGYEHM